ncbi:MAG: M20/M25/M40 family metallo-hydrolase [Chloroflexi bacterium]|uniref:M20/M25/M40 family metallo-hydrolase n=1 Tax=Candidatus Chlorohelix allophototropha TaxID=3003348 RepID=A0A8T7LQW6_9CHLR|nr:M20/M25/M40 family metallo-hydrolase [Chloroflexota bacterium]WJW66271.1 M20/M25/M40 family metallo-hydrolase [Chloroflexota bacterium L227-S17]
MELFTLTDLNPIFFFLFLLALGVSLSLGLYLLKMPKPVPATAPLDLFSSERAMQHLQAIGREPHPSGSPEHCRVGDYLLLELQKLGLDCQVQETTAVNDSRGCGRVRNIMGRLPGENPLTKILISAHYDTVPHSPGTTDNGVAVATLLETARALQKQPALHNDIVFLFTDGEEAGLLGAQAFVDSHPWAKQIGLVLNFDARGTRGPLLMYETSNDNGTLIREFAKAVPFPVASSFSYEISERLPTHTDFDVFKKAGWMGLSFACIGNLCQYHTMLDNLENCDERLLQHAGSYALSLLKHFGNIKLENSKRTNATYFNLFRSLLIHYPSSWNTPIALLGGAGLAATVYAGFNLKLLSFPGLLWGLILFLLTVLAVSVVTWLGWETLKLLHPQYRILRFGDTYNSHHYYLAFVLLAVALTNLANGWFSSSIGATNLCFGVLSGWVIASIVMNLVVPSAGYVFALPILSNLAGFGLIFALRNFAFDPQFYLALYGISVIPTLLILPATIALMFEALGIRLMFVTVIPVVFITGLLAPFSILLADSNGWIVSGILFVGCAVFLVIGSMSASFNQQRRKPDNIFYVMNADTGQAVWGSTDAQPDEWTDQFFGQGYNLDTFPDYFSAPSQIGRKVLLSQAPAVALQAPLCEVLGKTIEDDLVAIRLCIRSQRNAPVMNLYITNPSILESSVNGIQLVETIQVKPISRWGLRFANPPEAGIELVLKVKKNLPLTLQIIDQSYELPSIPGFVFKPRSNHIMPVPYMGFIPDSTLVKKTFEIGWNAPVGS